MPRVVHFLLPADNPKWAVAFYESWTITKWEWSLVDRDFVAVNLQADQCLADLFPVLRCEEALKVRGKDTKTRLTRAGYGCSSSVRIPLSSRCFGAPLSAL